jgi:UPF0755 protein
MDIKRPAKPTPPQPTSLPQPEPTSPLDLEISAPSLNLHHKKSRKWLWFLLIPLVIIVVAVASAVSALVWYQDALQPLSASNTAVSIKVESGATADQVAQELEQGHVIKSSLAFTLYMKLNNKNVIKTGTYFFAPNQSVSEIVSWLNDGRVGTRKVTILPGQTLVDLKKNLVQNGYTREDVDVAFAKTYTGPLFDGKPADASLEGYIFPETYFVTNDSTADQLLQRTFDEFEKRIVAANIKAQLSAHGFNLHQGITLASVVTKEVSNPTDQKQVAQVFETRLSRGMVLGSDVTYHYAASLLGVAPTPDINSPYNTHKFAGLPPGPIANFNMSALEAVANPAAGEYLYFVAGDDGKTYYATNFEQHQQNIQKYCVKLCTSN